MEHLVTELESLRDKASRERCSGLSAMDFQPLCRCGFDGKEGSLSKTLRYFEDVCHRLEADMILFFQQDKVKSRVQEWVDQRLEMNAQTLSYLEGEAKYPQIENLALFDQHLSGLQLVKPINTEVLLDYLGGRPWEKLDLMQALDRFLDRYGDRIAFRREKVAPRKELLAWCCEQALTHGRALPPFSADEQALIADLLRPQWISAKSLQRLEQMRLGEEAILRILGMLFDGTIKKPPTVPSSGPVGAALQLMDRQRPESPQALAGQIICLYGQRDRLLQLRRRDFLSRIDDLAGTQLERKPPSLNELLQSHLNAQWIVVDCLGLPFLSAIREILSDCFPHWQMRSTEFGLSSRQSSTEAFYSSLIENNFQKSFEKINVLDSLVHSRGPNLHDLATLGCAELEISFKKVVRKLDPKQPLLIFGDHGFRLSPDGTRFTHGGASTLERVTPVFDMAPRCQ